VNETSRAHVWRLRSRYLGTGYDIEPPWFVRFVNMNQFECGLEMLVRFV
jgi:hypothetical protein